MYGRHRNGLAWTDYDAWYKRNEKNLEKDFFDDGGGTLDHYSNFVDSMYDKYLKSCKNSKSSNLGIDPQTGRGVVLGGDGKEYNIEPRAKLMSADLAGVDLRGANLRQAELADANLKGADLREVYLADADLTSASLERADLRFADLNRAVLTWANLDGARLVGANFKYARVDPGNVKLIEAACREMISTIKVGGRTPNPSHRLVVEVRYVGGGGHSMGIPRYCVVDAAAPANRMMGPGGHYSESYAIATFDNRATAELYIDMVNGERAPNPGQGTRRGPGGYKY